MMMNTTELNESTISKVNEHDLIKGNFSPEDASEIINHLFAKKINFHERRNFSDEIRLGEVDQNSKERIKELKQSKASLNEFLRDAKEQGKSLRIVSSISVEII
jgi:2-hydroxy-3-keto-5-methylthiopentenyl-1-phosphate phosphatase